MLSIHVFTSLLAFINYIPQLISKHAIKLRKTHQKTSTMDINNHQPSKLGGDSLPAPQEAKDKVSG